MAKLDPPNLPGWSLEEALDEEAEQMMRESTPLRIPLDAGEPVPPPVAPTAEDSAVSVSFTVDADIDEDDLPADLGPIIQALKDLEHHGYALFVLHRKNPDAGRVVGSYMIDDKRYSPQQVRAFEAEASCFFTRLVQIGPPEGEL